MAVTIGIPRTLAFYTYYPLWATFLRELGVSVVVSGKTSKAILDDGVREAVSEACVPIKLFHGHVRDLAERGVDYLFIPRLVNTTRRLVYCPKFLGLPDMVRFSMPGLPPVLDPRIDLRRGRLELYRVFRTLARRLGATFARFFRAYLRALAVFARYRRLLRQGVLPTEAFRILGIEPGGTAAGGVSQSRQAGTALAGTARPLRLAVLGYPYFLYDSYLSVGLLDKLRALGVTVVTAEMLPDGALRRQSHRFGKELFWTYSDMIVRAGYHFFENGGVDGLIHVTAFGCGPDAMVDKLLELEARRRGKIPFLPLMIDEQTGEAGYLTRLEAFTDMIRRKGAA